MATTLLRLLALAALSGPCAGFTTGAERAMGKALDPVRDKIQALETAIEGGEMVENLGNQIDSLVEVAQKSFASAAAAESLSDNDVGRSQALLARQLEGPVSSLFLLQLRRLRDTVLDQFKTASNAGTSESAEFEAMLAADLSFKTEAEKAQPVESLALFEVSFDYGIERSELQELLHEVAIRTKSITDARLEAARQQSEVLKYLQKQQQELTDLQRSQFSGGSPWAFGCAYKVPLTNINLSGTYQNGKTKLVASIVDDSLLNTITPDQGFVTGVEEGAAGLSLNMDLR